jgi:hypothetical protein
MIIIIIIIIISSSSSSSSRTSMFSIFYLTFPKTGKVFKYYCMRDLIR